MKTKAELMQLMLAKVPDDVDKREGSIIYTALAPTAAMLAEQQWYADNIMNATMPDTARGSDLTRRCADFGINRYLASKAVRKGLFTSSGGVAMDVPIGTRFGAEGVQYTVTEAIDTGNFKLQCQQTGITGNNYFGRLLPVDNVSELGTAALSDVLIAGENEETDAELRTRFYKIVNTQPFGGNVDQYEAQILNMSGVGSVKVYPTPEGQGGRVQCVIVDPDNKPVSGTLLSTVQNTIDPEPHGKGYGLAPIGHTVTISTVSETAVNVTTALSLQTGYTLSGLQAKAVAAIRSYLESIAFKDNIVRVSRIEAALLSLDGVADISSTKINGGTSNLVLVNAYNNYQVPLLGTVTLTEAT